MKLLFSFLVLTSIVLSNTIVATEQPIKEVYRHGYGIIVSRSEWLRRGQDGNITKLLKDGTTVSETYYQGLLHGELVISYPHSTTIALTEKYEHGVLISRKHFFVNGLPKQEEIFQSDGSVTVSKWKDGDLAGMTPYISETFNGGLLQSGTYLTPKGDQVRIIDGTGIRPYFTNEGEIFSEETFSHGSLSRKTVYHPNGDPASVTQYQNGVVHGIKQTFFQGGIPNTHEEWRNGLQDGITFIFKNGNRIADIPFVQGIRKGLELRYNDKFEIVEEVSWKNNQLHGVRKIYSQDSVKKEWYHQGKPVSKSKFERLNLSTMS